MPPPSIFDLVSGRETAQGETQTGPQATQTPIDPLAKLAQWQWRPGQPFDPASSGQPFGPMRIAMLDPAKLPAPGTEGFTTEDHAAIQQWARGRLSDQEADEDQEQQRLANEQRFAQADAEDEARRAQAQAEAEQLANAPRSPGLADSPSALAGLMESQTALRRLGGATGRPGGPQGGAGATALAQQAQSSQAALRQLAHTSGLVRGVRKPGYPGSRG